MNTEKEVRFYRYENGDWQGTKRQVYKEKGENSAWRGVSRRVFVGKGKDRNSFELRYFEVEVGGYTSLEKHEHIHAVIGAKGKGKVIVDKEVYDLNTLDVIYIGPGIPHQFVNSGMEPFGFFCIVDRERDRPKLLSLDEVASLLENPKIRELIRYRKGSD